MTASSTILVVDDEPLNIEMLAAVFGGEHEIVFATSGERALALAATARPDLILLDVMMPDMDGYEVCRRLKADPTTAAIPIIFITGLGDAAAEARGLELGAVDYVTKPINPPVVRLRVRNHVQLKRASDALSQLVMTDGLTGIANRRRFDEVLEVEYRRLSRSGQPLALIMIDIDHFKAFNDACGHLAGDDCLRRVASVIKDAAVRAADLAARYGGEEFAVILPETDTAGAVQVARRIREGIAALVISHPASSAGPLVTVSQGIAAGLYCPSCTSEEIVSRADTQLYRAKSKGRNRIVVDGEVGEA